MTHLCVVNPLASQVNGHVDAVVDTIKDFFDRNPRMNHTIHVTRWKRDASGYVRSYAANASEMVRVYVFGGGGTLFEVANGVMGLPNVEIAYFPLGKEDSFLVSLGENVKDTFKSMPNLLFSRTVPIDTIFAGNHYVLSGISVGIGALAFRLGRSLSNRFKLPLRAAYALAGFYWSCAKITVQRYRLESENISLEDDFAGLFIANVPGNGGGFSAPEARLNDGYMNLYTVKPLPPGLALRIIGDCQKGMYAKWPQYVGHYRCKKLRLTSSRDMTMTLDGEFFYDTKLDLEVSPASLNLVCPPNTENSFFKTEADTQVPPEDLELPEGITVSDFVKSEDAT